MKKEKKDILIFDLIPIILSIIFYCIYINKYFFMPVSRIQVNYLMFGMSVFFIAFIISYAGFIHFYYKVIKHIKSEARP